MAETEQLKIQIVLDDGSVKTGFVDIEKQAKKSAKSMETSFSGGLESLAGSFSGLAASLAAGFSAYKVVQFFRTSAQAAMQAETAANAFGASLAQIGKYSQESVDSFNEYASRLQATTGVSDDLITQNAALLASIGKLSGEGLNQATKASLDLATALQIDVGTAFDLVAKAASGNVGALSRYGIKIDENIPKSEKFAATLKMIQERFGGLAETRLNTLAGSLINLGNSFDDFQESIGKFITGSPAIRAIINEIANSFFGLSKSIDGVRDSSGDLFRPMIEISLELSAIINNFIVKPLELVFNLLQTGFLAVNTFVNAMVTGFFQIGTSISRYFLEPLLNAFGFIAEKLVSLVNKELGQKMKAAIDQFGAQMTQGAQDLENSAFGIYKQSFDSLAKSADEAFTYKMGDSIDDFILRLKAAVAAAKEETGKYSANTAKDMDSASEAFANHLKAVNQTFSQGLVNSISVGVQHIGRSLAKGTFSAQDFGNTMLSIFGDLAIQLGTLMISFGIGINSLAASLATFNGFGAIAAGAALVAIGAAIKSLSTSGSAASAGVGGGIASQPSAATELAQPENLERAEPGTAVSVIVQGDILDSDESGSRIVNLINQAFDKKGVVINQAVLA